MYKVQTIGLWCFPSVNYVLFSNKRGIKNVFKKRLQPKLYIPSTLNTDYLLWHAQLIVCAVKYEIMV